MAGKTIPAWYEAAGAWIVARLEAGEKSIDPREALADFARWHGIDNLRAGRLRPEPPPTDPEQLALLRSRPASRA